MKKFLRANDRQVRLAVTGTLGLLAGLGGVSAAQAQDAFDRSRNVGVLDRPRAEYDALGVRAGTFLVYPRVDLGVTYDDNVFAAEADEIADAAYSVSPQITAESNWSRHELQITAAGQFYKYQDLSDEDYNEFRLYAQGRLDVRRDTNATGVLSYQKAIEPRGSSAYLTATQSPIEYTNASASFAGVRDFNRVRVSGNLGVSELDYDDGVSFEGAVIDQDFRDSNQTSATVRLDYAYSPSTALFGEVGFSQLDYDVVGGSRDSDGVRLLAGVNFELSNLVTGEISAGYITRAFEEGVADDIDQFAYRASVNWYPTELVTVAVGGETQINDSGLLNTPAYVADTVRVQVDYEPLRNLIVSGVADYSRASFQDLDRSDDRFGLGVSATYLVNRRAGITLTVNQIEQESSGAARTVDYTERSIGVALVLQL